MKKTLIYLLLILIGIGIGYTLNHSTNTQEVTQQIPEKIYIEKIKKEVIRDTIEIEKIINVPILVDSLYTSDTVYIHDTLSTENEGNNSRYIEKAENEEDIEEVIIIMEELIAQRTIPLDSAPIDSTDISKLLNLKSTAFSKEIIVEFWQSPLNITGYELTRNKLKLFGFNPNESISLQMDRNEEQLLLNTESMSIVLQKSKQFKTLKLK